MTVLTNAFQKKRLARVLVMLSKQACDASDFETAYSILNLAEDFMSKSLIPLREKRSMILLMIEAYEMLWIRQNT